MDQQQETVQPSEAELNQTAPETPEQKALRESREKTMEYAKRIMDVRDEKGNPIPREVLEARIDSVTEEALLLAKDILEKGNLRDFVLIERFSALLNASSAARYELEGGTKEDEKIKKAFEPISNPLKNSGGTFENLMNQGIQNPDETQVNEPPPKT